MKAKLILKPFADAARLIEADSGGVKLTNYTLNACPKYPGKHTRRGHFWSKNTYEPLEEIFPSLRVAEIALLRCDVPGARNSTVSEMPLR